MRRVIENGRIKAEIDDVGAELSVLYDKEHERNVLFNGDPTWWNRKAPVLFPIVGGVKDKKYRYQGSTYEMGQHGFARDSIFEVVEQSETHIVHHLSWSKETLKNYPFKFSLYITHRIQENQLRVGWKVVNEQNEEMYFAIGAHPAFLVPVEDKGQGQEDYFLSFAGKKKLEYLRITGAGYALPKEETPMELTDGMIKLSRDMFADGVYIFEDGQVEHVGISFPDKTPYLAIACQGFPYMGIWSKPGAPFICLEPWYGRTDADDFKGEFPEKPGMQRLLAKETFVTEYQIIIY